MHNNNTIVPYVSLCSGYEGIGLGLHRVIPNLRCVGYCEREAFAIANLVKKMENGLLDAAPVFTDVTTFPWADYSEIMAGGILSFGWPCQPVSCAGKRKATEDERWLFDIIADGISIMRPGILFAENVEGLLSAKMPDGSLVFAHCIERLESLHYKVAAGIFSASEVGAPHQRKRVFILAHAIVRRTPGSRNELGNACQTGQGGQDFAPNSFDVWPSRPGEPQHGWEPPRVVANPRCGQHGRRQNSEGSIGTAQGESGEADKSLGNAMQPRPPSERTSRWQQNGLGQPSDEAMGHTQQQGLERQRNDVAGFHRKDEGVQPRTTNGDNSDSRQTQPPLGRDLDGPAGRLGYAQLCVSTDNRTDELRLLGNGVVPAAAERAFRTLMEEIRGEKTQR